MSEVMPLKHNSETVLISTYVTLCINKHLKSTTHARLIKQLTSFNYYSKRYYHALQKQETIFLKKIYK